MKKTVDYVNSLSQNTVPKQERLYQRLERQHIEKTLAKTLSS